MKRCHGGKGIARVKGGILKIREYHPVELLVNAVFCFHFDPAPAGTPKLRRIGILIDREILDARKRQFQVVGRNSVDDNPRPHRTCHTWVREDGGHGKRVAV